MGWWGISNVSSGGLPREDEPQLKRDDVELVTGDGPADVMDKCVDKIAHMYKDAFGRWPQKDELVAVLNFCTNTGLDSNDFYAPRDVRKPRAAKYKRNS